MKLTEKECRDCRIDALADVMPDYRVQIIPGAMGPELCRGAPCRIDAGYDFRFRTELLITVGAEYIRIAREHAGQSTKETNK